MTQKELPPLTAEAFDRMLEQSAVFQRRIAALEAALVDAVDDARDAVMRAEMAASRAELAAADAREAMVSPQVQQMLRKRYGLRPRVMGP